LSCIELDQIWVWRHSIFSDFVISTALFTLTFSIFSVISFKSSIPSLKQQQFFLSPLLPFSPYSYHLIPQLTPPQPDNSWKFISLIDWQINNLFNLLMHQKPRASRNVCVDFNFMREVERGFCRRISEIKAQQFINSSIPKKSECLPYESTSLLINRRVSSFWIRD
jgi:hypothetical protein